MHFSNFVKTIHTILIFVSESCGKQLCTQNLYNNSMYPYSVVFVLLVSRFSQNYCKIHGINAVFRIVRSASPVHYAC